MIFADDASAMIAIILGEDNASDLSDRIEAERMRLCSALSVWETVAALCRARALFRAGRQGACRTFP